MEHQDTRTISSVSESATVRPASLWLVLALMLVLAACSSDTADTTSAPPDSTGAATSEVSIDDFAFAPGSLTVAVGDTASWTNDQSIAHTTTGTEGDWDSGTLGTGETFGFTFQEAGTFEYFCAIHPSMTGTVVVTDGS